MSIRVWLARTLGFGLVLAFIVGIAAAQNAARPSLDSLRRSIVTQTPEIKVGRVFRDRLIVHRLDIVDESGAIRATLAAPSPDPVTDGIQYRRGTGLSGLTVYDGQGNERGTFGVSDAATGAPVGTFTHANSNGIESQARPDGSASITMQERAPIQREPALGNHSVPMGNRAARVRLEVAANGTPSIALADKQNRPRVRITVTEAGYGAIEFLDARGKVIHTLAPEAP